MSPHRLLRMLAPPRYVVQRGMLTTEDMHRLSDMRSHDVVAIEGYPSAITMLPHPPIHIHMAPQRPCPTASMGPTMRRR